MQAYFGRAKAACLCSYCCNRHLWCYDGRRWGRVKIVTLRVSARAKGGKGGGEKKISRFLFSLPAPFSPFFPSSNMALSRATSGARRKRLYCRLVTHRSTSSLLACVIKNFQCSKNFFMPFFFFFFVQYYYFLFFSGWCCIHIWPYKDHLWREVW